MKAKFYDTLLGEYIKNPGKIIGTLEKIAKRDFNYKMINFDDIVKKQKLSNFSEIELKLASKYSAEEVYITYKLLQKQKAEKILSNKILKEIELPLIQTLKNIEINGVKIDRNRLKELGNIFENEIIKLKKSIYNEAKEEFNINSPKQVGEILFDKLKLPKGKKTKKGWSVNAETLNNLSKKHFIAKKIVDYRHYSKLNSTYITGLLNLLDKNDLLHTNYNQTVTSTGRLSSINPNLQNIPSGNSIAGEIRSAFISRFKNGKIITFDYSQVEIRILALISKETKLIEAFKKGYDIHTKTAELIGIKDRKIAKAVNFGVIYGLSAFGLSKIIDISVKESREYIKKFFETYPKVKDYIENTIKFTENNGYIETFFGRRRYINGINDANKIIKQKAEREAINMPIQGTSADIIKIAMNRIFNYLMNNKLKSKIIIQVHDELVFDVFPGEEEKLTKNITQIMENILENKDITLKIDYGIGNNWKEAK